MMMIMMGKTTRNLVVKGNQILSSDGIAYLATASLPLPRLSYHSHNIA